MSDRARADLGLAEEKNRKGEPGTRGYGRHHEDRGVASAVAAAGFVLMASFQAALALVRSVGRASRLPMPGLAIAGEATTPFMIETARVLADSGPAGRSVVLEVQGHDIDPEALRPVIKDFRGVSDGDHTDRNGS